MTLFETIQVGDQLVDASSSLCDVIARTNVLVWVAPVNVLKFDSYSAEEFARAGFKRYGERAEDETAETAEAIPLA